jgi:DNA-binding NtrC family response regulator
LTAKRPSILLVEDDAHLAEQLRWGLRSRYRLKVAGDRLQAVEALRRWHPDLVLMDLCLPPENSPEEGFRIMRAAQAGNPPPTVIVMSALEEREAALRAVSEGAYDFFSKPIDLTALRVVLGRAAERQALENENRRLREQIRTQFSVDSIVGRSAAMRPVLEAIRRVKDSVLTVLVQGASGTGKEVVARAIHSSGPRGEGPFVSLHCAAFPQTLLEAEMFGHEKGAFTGATEARVGRFEAADGGTLFLDEIGCLNAEAQMKLLRVLEDRTVERLGSNRSHRVDIRLIAATNEDLEEKVERGEFREDLFFRVNVFPICLPPLRERNEDIILLADHFMKRVCEEGGIPPKRFSPKAKQSLLSRDWPGNVRELLNLVQQVTLVADQEVVDAVDLPRSRRSRAGRPPPWVWPPGR